MKSKNIQYIQALDHLRAFAALLIIFYHGLHLLSYQIRFGTSFTFENWLRSDNVFLAFLIEGHTAVTVFFLLSGFVLTLGSYKKDLHYGKFICNRVLRVYPLFIFLIIVGIYTLPNRFELSALIQTLVGLANIQKALDIGAFSAMFWAVAVVWQFYLIFPFLIKFTNSKGPKYLLCLLLLMIVFRIVAFYVGNNIRDLSYFSIIGRLDQFLLGMLGAIYYMKSRPRGLKWLVVSIAALVGIFASQYWFHRIGGWPLNHPFRLVWHTYEGAMWLLFILSYITYADRIPNVISKTLLSIGAISYSLFLVHFTIIERMIHQKLLIQFSQNLFANCIMNTLIIAIPLTIFVAVLTYHFIEKPFLSMRCQYHVSL